MNARAVTGAFGLSFLFLSSPVSFAQDLNFRRDIAPIISQHCASCHRPGDAAPFSLLTYDDAKRHAAQIAKVTQSRSMPPWLPEPGRGEFANANRLTADQIRTIANWVAQGAPEGPADDAPPPAQFSEGWQLGQPDLIVDAEKAFDLAPGGPDVDWNFILTPALAMAQYVRAIEVRLDDKRLIRHASLVVDGSHWARPKETTPGGGFPGMQLLNARNIFDPDDGHLVFWTPGTAPYVEPDGLAWRIAPGDELVLSARLHPSGKPEQVRPSVALYFADKPQDKFPILIQLEHDGALDIPAGARDFLVSDDFRLPVDTDVLAVYPHAHPLGRLVEAYATLPDGKTRKWLIRIPEWNPAWESVYRFSEPVFLPKGSVISMRFHFDNSAANIRNPNQPPRRVHASEKVTGEMGSVWLQVLPRGSFDRHTELNEALMQHRLQKYPNDFRAHMVLGALYMGHANVPAAAELAEAAVRLRPDDAEARNLLASVYGAEGRVTDAIGQYRRAVALRPDFVKAHFNLANALASAGHLEEAIAEYHEVVGKFSNEALVKDRLVKVLWPRARQLWLQGKDDQAESHYRELVSLMPNDVAARIEFGDVLLHTGKQSEATEQFDHAFVLDPQNPDVLARHQLK